MTRRYEHSDAFAKLKGIRERLEGNATTPQYLLTLDNYITNAVTPLIRYTNVIEALVANLLGWQERNRKRKASFLSPDDFRLRAVVWLCTPSLQDKLDSFRKLSIDRGALLSACSSFVAATRFYVSLRSGTSGLPVEDALARAAVVEREFGATSDLLLCVREVDKWLADATDFRSKILEKYVRLCLVRAQFDYVNVFNLTVPLNDIVQAYVLAAGRAIDKCDHRQGVLTTHVTYWLLTARAALLKSPTTVPIEDAHVEHQAHAVQDPAVDALERAQLSANLKFVSVVLDPDGYGRAFLGLAGPLPPLD